MSRTVAVQFRLSKNYKGDRYIHDLLKEAIDVPSGQDVLKDRPAKSSEELKNMVANKVSIRPETAGALSVNFAEGRRSNDLNEVL